MKMIYKIIIAIICIVIIIIIGLIYYTSDSIKDGDDMINRLEKYNNLKCITYEKSGDMIGSSLTMKIEHFDEYDLLTKKERPSHSEELITKEYKLSSDTLEKFKESLVKYKYENWKDLERSNEFIYDAGTSEITFYFSNYEKYSIDEYMILPKTEDDLFKMIYDFFNKKINELEEK